MRNMYYVDMHCHPAIKPYSWLMKNKKNPSKERNIETSLWYNDPPTRRDKALNKLIGLTKFTQSDFRTLGKGDVRIISACLNPIERGLFTFRGIWKILPPRLLKFVIEISMNYIRLVRKKDRKYFDELKEEYEFYKTEWKNQDKIFPTRFELTSKYSQIKKNLNNTKKEIISVFFSIEGCHVFNNGGLESSLKDVNDVKQNIQTVKNWKYRPLYVSMAHHMNNDLCGHARSLSPCLGRIINQKERMGNGFSDLGEKVLHKLLEKETGRIYIDIKHMSVESRMQYYEILDQEYKDENIPVLASHGAVNGSELIKKWNEEMIHNEDKKIFHNEDKKIFQDEVDLKFNNEDVNFFDDEIIRMEETGGFLGIQLDERRLCYAKQKRRERRDRTRSEQLYFQAGLVWKQIRYIAELLDGKNKFGWGTATIGSDYDGLVDPPNGYWTSDDFGILEENLIHHAKKYLNNVNPLKVLKNKSISPEVVITRFMRDNALQFLKKFLC